MNDPERGREIARRLLRWYRDGHRALPWRDTRDPYRILVSEVMLQQTQAERVIPKYHEFLERFPTLQALADVPASEVIRAWAGLGYNRRALNLQRACRAVVERFGGVMPSDPADLGSLPGIGPYTAGAVACFGYGREVAFVDTNIRRVLHRVLAGPELPEPSLSAREIEAAARALLPAGEAYEWNQALMELGATLCRARSVACEVCPLRDVCAARPVIRDVLASRPPSRRKRELRFETTSRFYRGRIIDALRVAPPVGLSLSDLATSPGLIDLPADVLEGHIGGLMRDGLIVSWNGSASALREDAPAYDSGLCEDQVRYRLPD